MNKRDTGIMANGLGRGERAILHPSRAAAIDVRRFTPPPDLAHWVDYFWIVRWQAEEPHTQAVIPQPVIHLAAETSRVMVHGVGDNRFSRTLTGTGHVLGVALRPGGFRPILGRPVNSVTRSVTPIGDLLGFDDRPLARRLLRRDATDEDIVAVAEEWLRGLRPERDPMVDAVAGLVAAAEHDHTITRADQLAEQAGMSLRTLQRVFGDYVGIGPKWVVRRFRLLDAAAAANSGADVDWATVAADLGFSDQAHLTRLFTEVVGIPPASYHRGERSDGECDRGERSDGECDRVQRNTGDQT